MRALLADKPDGVYPGSCTIEAWFEAYESGYHARQWEQLCAKSRILITGNTSDNSITNFTGAIPTPVPLGG